MPTPFSSGPVAPDPASLPLWPLALLAALLPLAAGLVAMALSMHLELVPSCNPFIDGCVSVSRAARHGLPNHIFRSLMIPAATLQGLVWLLAARWLRGELGPAASSRWLAPLGLLAAVALVVYASFLGTEGPIYRMLRQYGTVVYYGFTCICLLLASGALNRMARAGKLALPRAVRGVLLTLGLALVTLGIVNAIVAAFFGAELKGRIENVTEWWASLIFVLGFAALAALWWRQRVRLTLR